MFFVHFTELSALEAVLLGRCNFDITSLTTSVVKKVLLKQKELSASFGLIASEAKIYT